MTASNPRWTVFYALVLPFFGLALCVFTWGLQYKLSLYDPPQAASHEIPTAKLLSKNEQSAKSESPLISKPTSSDKTLRTVLVSLALAFFLLTLAVLNRLVLVVKGSAAKRPLRLRSWGNLNAFFFRPPPALA